MSEPRSPERVIFDHWWSKHPDQRDPSWPDEIRSLLDALDAAGYSIIRSDSWRLRSDFGVAPAPRMMHGRSRSGQTISEHVHPWEPDCDVRGCVSEADYSGRNERDQ